MKMKPKPRPMCADNQTSCNGKCCDQGYECCTKGQCCPTGKCCGAGCCTEKEFCSDATRGICSAVNRAKK